MSSNAEGELSCEILEEDCYYLSQLGQKFLDRPSPRGHEQFAMDRGVQKAVGVLGELLEVKWKDAKSQKR